MCQILSFVFFFTMICKLTEEKIAPLTANTLIATLSIENYTDDILFYYYFWLRDWVDLLW